jgi:hypothetical protein
MGKRHPFFGIEGWLMPNEVPRRTDDVVEQNESAAVHVWARREADMLPSTGCRLRGKPDARSEALAAACDLSDFRRRTSI